MAGADHSIDDERAELEARFRELEAEEQVARIRRGGGDSERATAGERNHAADPLAGMKAHFADDAPAARFLLVVCPDCQAKNRASLAKLRDADPLCGACGRPLAR